MVETVPARAAPISQERAKAVETARQGWIRRLIDLSRRNRLLYFRPLKIGTIDLTNADPKEMQRLLAGKKVRMSRLLPEDEDDEDPRAPRQVRAIARKALENLEEKGLRTLYLALGFATWPAADGGRPPEAPVVLLPLATEEVRGDPRQASLIVAGEPQVNPVLLHVLEHEYKCELDPEDFLEEPEENEPFDPTPVFNRFEQAASAIEGFGIRKPTAYVGNFSFQKMAMVRDLEANWHALVANDLIAAIAGDADARASVAAGREDIAPDVIDRRSPDEEFIVLDADSSQQMVIERSLAGQCGVIQGPPGTGKSQTIANLIVCLAARGKRVLFVAEKRAALEAVTKRLVQTGLGHLVLDLHGADVSRRAVMAKLAEALQAVRHAPPVDADAVHRRYVDRRDRLNEYVRELHQKRDPSGVSVFEMRGRLLRMPRECESRTRWRRDALHALTPEVIENACDLLQEAGGHAELFLHTSTSPWTAAKLPSGEAVQSALDACRALYDVDWYTLGSAISSACERRGHRQPASWNELDEMLRLWTDVERVLKFYDGELFAEDLQAVADSLLPAGRGWPSRLWAAIFNGKYKHSCRRLRGMCREASPSARQLLADVKAADKLVGRWASFAEGDRRPCAGDDLPGLRERFEETDAAVSPLASVLTRCDLRSLPLEGLQHTIEEMHADQQTAYRVMRLNEIETTLKKRGLASIATEIRQKGRKPHLWLDSLKCAWLRSCLEDAQATTPKLAGFSGSAHSEIASEFRGLDGDRLDIAADRVRKTHACRAVASMDAHPDQDALVRREAAKSRRHLPLRKLLKLAPDVLLDLCPCCMASPLSVSQLLDADRKYFDVVLFDEASQVLPEDAVPAIMRGSQAVAAGDRYQLPPTTFFMASEEDLPTEEDTATEGFESLLDILSALFGDWMLEWHYRSRDERLIAFSNHHIYRDRLVTFPGVGGQKPVTHVLVPHEPGRDGQEESSSPEVRRVVDLVLEHAEQLPNETLGVIGMGLKHARRVEAAIDDAVRDRPDLWGFFAADREERFFVKNLERVQGDERDAVILTVGYGKDRSGNLPHRFGPLNYRGGERRLNVAVSRARKRMTVVSSFAHVDVDPARTSARGAQLLRYYLEYAATGGNILGDRGTSDTQMNPFESDVYEALTARGVDLLPQYGCSNYRIDFVAQHPRQPGKLVLAIECDGASYHSCYTARDRDRIRQEHLEALGWRFHRIWSTDWFHARDTEIERTVRAYELAVSRADRQEQGHSMAVYSHPEDAADSAPSGTPVTSAKRPTPRIPRLRNIDEYSMDWLVKLVRYIESDGQNRTVEELMDELMDILPYKRRGSRIVAALRRAIGLARAHQ